MSELNEAEKLANEEYPKVIGTNSSGFAYDENGRARTAFEKGYNWKQDECNELLKENRHLSIQLKEAHEVIKDYQDVARIRDKEIVQLNVELVQIKEKVRLLCIQHQQLLDKAIDEKITDEETDGYKQSIDILDDLRKLIN